VIEIKQDRNLILRSCGIDVVWKIKSKEFNKNGRCKIYKKDNRLWLGIKIR
jgi:hypothetical protein